MSIYNDSIDESSFNSYKLLFFDRTHRGINFNDYVTEIL